jgi:hypothetical protein
MCCSHFRHPNIIRLLGYTSITIDEKGACLVYEMGSRGSLGKHWRSEELRESLQWKQRVRIACGICSALNYLHCHNPCGPAYHRDIKSDNIVLTADFTPKLIDCGLATFCSDSAGMGMSMTRTKTGMVFGTRGYMCHKYSGGMIQFNAKCEVYSVGIVLLEIMMGRLQGADDVDLSDLGDDEIIPDERAGEWEPACVESLVKLASECLMPYARRKISKIIDVLRDLRKIEADHCRLSPEEVKAMAEVRRLQRESEQRRATDALVEGLYATLVKQEQELAAARHEAITAVQERAARAQKEEQEMAAQTVQCGVCFEDVRRASAALCHEQHAICSACLSAQVHVLTHQENMAEFQKAGMRLPCPQCLPRNSVALSAKEVVSCIDEEAFEKLLSARDKLTEGIAVAGPQRRVRELEDILAAEKASAARQIEPLVELHRRKIIEDILTLKCPRENCRAAFLDFDGCFALTCRYVSLNNHVQLAIS